MAPPSTLRPPATGATVRRRALRRLSLACLPWLAAPLLAQGTDGVRFDPISVEDGLAQSTVYGIAQTSGGFMWLGTEGGLNRYDGYTLGTASASRATRGVVRVLLRDRADVLWLGTYSAGLVRFDPATGVVRVLRHDPRDPATLDGDGIRALAEGRGGDLWVGSDAGVARVDTATVEVSRLGLGDVGAGVRALVEDRGGTLWVGTEGVGLLSVAPAGNVARRDVSRDLGAAAGHVTALYEDRAGRLWLGTHGAGVARVEPTGGGDVVLRPVPALDGAFVRALLEDREGTLWIGARAGLHALDADGGHRVFRHDPLDPSSLPDDNVRCLLEDSSGLLWIGTTSGGAVRYDRHQHRFSLYRHGPGGLSEGFVWAVYRDAGGPLWVGTGGGGLDRLDPDTGEVRVYRHEPGDPRSLASDHVKAILRDRHGDLWVGTVDAGLDRMVDEAPSDETAGTFVHHRHDPADPSTLGRGAVQALLEDRAGELWVLLWGGGLARLDRASGRFERRDVCAESRAPGAAPEPCHGTALAEDADGNLWIAVYRGGLYRLGPDRGRPEVLRHRPGTAAGLPDDQPLALAVDGDGLWLGTALGAVARLDLRGGGVTTLDWQREHQGLAVYAVLAAPASDLWLSTNRGLWRLSPDSGEHRRYDVRDGLQHDEFNAGAAFRDQSTGELYFGGVRGLNRFHPGQLADNPHPPPVVITSVRRLDGEVLPTSRGDDGVAEVVLGPRDRFVGFEVAALDFRDPAKNRYRYRLEGQDDGWIEAGHRRFASYTNLPPGRFVLHVQGSNSDGVWTRDGARLAVRVVPPFWRTWWFRGLLGALVSGLVVGGPLAAYRRRLRRAERARREEREIRRRLVSARERERARLALELHDGPLQGLHALRLTAARGRAAEPRRRDVADGLEAVAGELRGVCARLRPPSLARGRLADAVRAHEAAMEGRRGGVAVTLDLMDDGGRLPEEVRLHLFRIYQEATSNVVQHAGARHARVRFEVDAEGCVLTVRDDGRGFEAAGGALEQARREHFGLLGMSERCQVMGGRLELRSRPGEGTELRVEVPLGAADGETPAEPGGGHGRG